MQRLISTLILAVTIAALSGVVFSKPCPRNQPEIAYHEVQRAIFLFGGFCSTSKTRVNDLWKYKGGSWTEIKAPGAPPARSGHSIVYDSGSDRIVVFGGKTNDGVVLNDTWEFKDGKWTKLEGPSPPSRQSHELVYDFRRNTIVLFGGSNKNRVSYGDTWILENRNWKEINPVKSPPPRLQHTMALDRFSGNILLFGGFDRTPQGKVVYGDTWEFDGLEWTRKGEDKSIARDHHAMAYDLKTRRMVLFGGYNEGYLGDTRYWNGRRWVLITNDGVSPRAGKPGLVYDSLENSLILYGGWGKENRPMTDFWKFSRNWRKLSD